MHPARHSLWPLSARVLTASLFIAALPALAQYSGSTPVPAELKTGFDAITVEDAKKWLEYLAGPECEGRGTGQEGFQKAADYMAARFKEFGLKPVGDKGTFFQNVPFTRSRISPDDSTLKIGDLTLKPKDGWSANGSADTEASGAVVFIRAKGPEARIEDTSALKDKIVVAYTSETGRGLRNDIGGSGAAMIFYVAEKVSAPEWQVRRTSTNTPPGRRATSGTLSLDLAKRLAAQVKVPGSALDLSGVAANTATITPSTETLSVAMKVQKQDIGVPNVVALLEGSDPKLKEEVIGVGAHLDHLGVSGGRVYYGADDDGSGCTALLSIAKALSVNPTKPKRSVLFMAFCGEEMGLIGSAYYAENPLFPHEKMHCELQMDMVGRNSYGVQNGNPNRVDVEAENKDTMRLVGSKRISQELDDIIQDANKHVSFKFKYDSEDVYTRSDHYNFARKGIPIAFLFDGFTPDYHQPTDTVDKINYEKLTNAAKLFYLVTHRAGNMDRPLKRNPSGG